jgi:hypothetical protein
MLNILFLMLLRQSKYSFFEAIYVGHCGHSEMTPDCNENVNYSACMSLLTDESRCIIYEYQVPDLSLITFEKKQINYLTKKLNLQPNEPARSSSICWKG